MPFLGGGAYFGTQGGGGGGVFRGSQVLRVVAFALLKKVLGDLKN